MRAHVKEVDGTELGADGKPKKFIALWDANAIEKVVDLTASRCATPAD